MLQRKQSLFLLLAIVAYVLLFFFPIAEYSTQGVVNTFSLLNISNANSNSTMPLIIVVSLLAATCFVTIFLFKNRILQIKITAIALLVHIGFIAWVFYSSGKIEKSLDTISSYKAGMYIVLVPVLFIVLAHRAIRRDEKMVKSSDRLR